MYQSFSIVDLKSLFIAVLGVFIVIIISMFYSSSKIKKENIVDVLRKESI
jgi:putative ABC transport system permease protein